MGHECALRQRQHPGADEKISNIVDELHGELSRRTIILRMTQAKLDVTYYGKPLDRVSLDG
jgi:hypothetical protein